jgi:antitoxin HicB
MADQYVYPADIKQDEMGSWLVTFPDFPEAATDGETLDEAIAEARDCLEEAIAARIDEGADLPKASPHAKDQFLVSVPLQMALKAAVFEAFKEARISKRELARRLSIKEAEARRILDPRHNTRADRLDCALHVLGRRFRVGVGRNESRAA